MEQSILDRISDNIKIYQFDKNNNAFNIEALLDEQHSELFLELGIITEVLKEHNIKYEIKDDLSIQLG